MYKRTQLTVVLLLALFICGALPVSAQVTATQQLFVIKECKPGVQKVGVIVSSKDAADQAFMADLNRAGAAAGVKVFVATVDEIKDVAPKFRDLTRSQGVQAIWVPKATGAIADATSRKFVITNATQSRIPLFAPAATWVKEGAAVSLSKGADGISLSVNKAAADASALQIPDKYKERMQLVAAN